VLNATVAPTAAVGSVTFKEGTTVLGTAAVAGGLASHTVLSPAPGVHAYSASFVPTDPNAFVASDAAPQSWTIAAGTGGITVTLTVPVAVQTEPGSLTLGVPASATVALAGARDTGNTRVTATADLPIITVTDTRRADLLTGWQVNVQASDFTGPATIGAKYLGWKPAAPVVTKTGGSLDAQAGPEVSSFLDSAVSSGLSVDQLLGKSIASGQGSTTLGSTLNLAIPSATAQGSYTSTITVTLMAS
jgi:hypothetical protein